MSDSISVTHNSERHQFEATRDGQTAVAQYRMSGQTMTVTHIVVPPPIEGQGIGSALARFAVQTARDQGLTLVPQCPFMAAYFERHPDDRDVLAS